MATPILGIADSEGNVTLHELQQGEVSHPYV